MFIRPGNGQLVAALGEGTNYPEFVNVAWDNVGNLYATEFSDGFSGEFLAGFLAAWKQPGQRRLAFPSVQVYQTLLPAILINPMATNGQSCFTMQGQNNVTYVIQASPDLANWTNQLTNYATAAIRAITVPSRASPVFTVPLFLDLPAASEASNLWRQHKPRQRTR